MKLRNLVWHEGRKVAIDADYDWSLFNEVMHGQATFKMERVSLATDRQSCVPAAKFKVNDETHFLVPDIYPESKIFWMADPV